MPAWRFIIQDRLLAYSAHWDGRRLDGLETPYVRVLAYSMEWRVQGNGSPTMYDSLGLSCTFLYADDATSSAPAKFVHIGKGHRLIIQSVAR
jgi:hypothetical protein